MSKGKNSAKAKNIVRAPATKFAHLQKKSIKNRIGVSRRNRKTK